MCIRDRLYTQRFDGFCLVSSDSDFTRLAQRLREEGLLVYGFGEKKTPDAFVQACDKFVYTEVLRTEAPPRTAAKPAAAAPAKKAAKSAPQKPAPVAAPVAPIAVAEAKEKTGEPLPVAYTHLDVYKRQLAENGVRAEVVIEAAGHPRAFETAVAATAPGGITVTVGLPSPDARSTIAPLGLTAVSYTHLDVYKRQGPLLRRRGQLHRGR